MCKEAFTENFKIIIYNNIMLNERFFLVEFEKRNSCVCKKMLFSNKKSGFEQNLLGKSYI